MSDNEKTTTTETTEVVSAAPVTTDPSQAKQPVVEKTTVTETEPASDED